MNRSCRKCESDLWVIVYFVCATREFSHTELYMCGEGVSDTWGQPSHRPGSLYSSHENNDVTAHIQDLSCSILIQFLGHMVRAFLPLTL